MKDDGYWNQIREWAERNGADGCSMASGAFLDCCLEHDMHYRTGQDLDGQPITREKADERFRSCMQRRSWLGWYSPMAWIRWAAVRAFGSSSYVKAVPVVLMVMLLTGCAGSKERIQKAHTVLIEAIATAQMAVVSGCDGLPTLQVALSLVEPYLQKGSTMTMIKDNSAVAAEFCSKIKAAQAAKG